jgi:TonB family protein
MMLGPVVALAAAALSFEPPQLAGGAVPGTPARDVGGGEVWLELQVSSTGAVDHVVTLRETPPYTEEMQRLVKGWGFRPAREGGMPVDGRVLVMAQFRPPTLLGGAIGQPPEDVASASAGVAGPVAAPMPGYPAEAEGDGTVLLQATVGADGKVQAMRTIRGSGPFESMALDAVRGWTFRPATRDGVGVPGVVCVVMSFRSPAVGPTEVPGQPPPPPPQP